MIYSQIKYGLIIYGFTTKSNINKLQTLQNKLLKVLTFKDRRYPTNDIHSQLKILKIEDIFYQEKVSFVHNFINDKLPPTFQNYFTEFAQVHNIETRNKNHNLIIPRHKTNIGASTIKINGAKMWNDLDANIKQILNIKIFRKNIKEKILPYP